MREVGQAMTPTAYLGLAEFVVGFPAWLWLCLWVPGHERGSAA